MLTLPGTQSGADDRASTPAAAAARPFIATTFFEANAVFSPDGRWLAYQSNQSGRFEIYVRPFPEGAGTF